MTKKLIGLVAATHSPFLEDGGLNLAAVEAQAEHLVRNGVESVFVGGSTGECHSLTVEERLRLTERWTEIARGSALRVVVHVGGNCLADARALAEQAERLGADAISAHAPSYFKPATLEALVACCAEVAAAAPGLPFYYYDIPSMTGVRLPMPEFLAQGAARIPTLAGIKFTNPDLMAYQQCLRSLDGRFDIPWGSDETLLAALAVGASGCVGSTYNFAPAVYQRLLSAFAKGDLESARVEQLRSVELVARLMGSGFLAATKAVMGFLGVEVGPPRLPITRLSPAERETLRASLERLGFFEWIKR